MNAKQLLFGFTVNSEQSDTEMLTPLSSGLTQMNFLVSQRGYHIVLQQVTISAIFAAFGVVPAVVVGFGRCVA